VDGCSIDTYTLHVIHSTIEGVSARQMLADHDGIQATLIAMEIGSCDPQIQSCGLALLSCAIVESNYLMCKASDIILVL